MEKTRRCVHIYRYHIDDIVLEKFPFLVWGYGHIHYGMKKYFDMAECYKYSIKNARFVCIQFENNEIELFNILKNMYKYQKTLIRAIHVDIDNLEVEKFFRYIIEDGNINVAKEYIINFITHETPHVKYHDILTGIVNFKWKKSYVLRDVIFV